MGTLLRLAVAAGVAYAFLRLGVGMVRGLAAPPPTPPPTGELRKVKLRYRCLQCGMELRVDHASDEDPEPPRHCMDEMELVAAAE